MPMPSRCINRRADEVPRTVIIECLKNYDNIFQEKLLCTAITRGKGKSHLRGDGDELAKLILSANEDERDTFLEII